MTYLEDFFSPRVEDSNLLIFTGSEEEGAVPVEAAGVDGVRVGVNGVQRLCAANVPYDNEVVRARRQQDVVSCRVP